jgi:hypothetical protein
LSQQLASPDQLRTAWPLHLNSIVWFRAITPADLFSGCAPLNSHLLRAKIACWPLRALL